ncbi:DUF3310 domain-containing protein [Actinomadura sp. KC216]|uniref:DUF3310 domain-containing protein n=1 Tax=Actinomadura sp. KC216 TaxID=2530370 RepID=UPI001A9F21B8|nr:DUF3310 domain-containing protein [Actinomadura sp. KC216]
MPEYEIGHIYRDRMGDEWKVVNDLEFVMWDPDGQKWYENSPCTISSVERFWSPLVLIGEVPENHDPINSPRHYADGWSNGAEVIDIAEHLTFNRGAAVKYLARAGRKDPETELEDLKKAQWFVNREVALLEAGRSNQ